MCTESKAQTINLPASRSACFVGSSHTKLHTHSRPNDPMHCPVQHLGNQRHLPGPRRWDVTLPAVSTAETATILPVHCWYNHPEMETEKKCNKTNCLLYKSPCEINVRCQKKTPYYFSQDFWILGKQGNRWPPTWTENSATLKNDAFPAKVSDSSSFC